jgi:prephenate dehydrogenase
VATAVAVAVACGAVPIGISAERHDVAMAAVSHVPQVVASMLAAATGELRPGELALAGQGFRDTTRIADSDPQLWASILEGNRGPLVSQLRRMATGLSELADTFDTAGEDVTLARVRELIGRGNAGRALLPGKAGAPGRTWSWVSVVLDDRPGQLGALFTAIGRWEFNVEDVGPFEHSLDAPAGIVEIAVDPKFVDELVERLTTSGWTAYRRS